MSSNLREKPAVAGLGRDVLIAVALKCLLLWAIYCLFFPTSHQPRSDATSTADALVGTGARRPL